MKAVHLPEEKLNELAQEVSESLLTSHTFNQEGVIRGEELSAFTEHEQINKFLLFQVYQVWNMQISKLKHPFFDFEHAEIQEALQDLRNLLSRHILIAKDEFQPLLQRAVYNNLKLLLDPHDAFSSFFFINGNQTSVELFGRYVPFFSDLDFVVNSILKYCQKNDFSTVDKDTFFEKMERVFALYSQKSGQHIDQYRNAILQKLSGKSLEEIETIALNEEARLESERQAALAKQEEEEKARIAAEEAAKAEAEAEAKRLAEEAAQAQAEAEALRLEEAARLKAEQEKQAKEEALRKASLFDTLSAAKATDVFDIDLEDDSSLDLSSDEAESSSEPETIAIVEEKVEEEVEETLAVKADPTTFDLDEEIVVEESAEELAEEVEEIVASEAEAEVTEEVAEVVAAEEAETEPLVEEVPAIVEEVALEEVATPEEKDEFLEMAASMEPPVEEEEKTKTILDSFIEKQAENGSSVAPSILESVSKEESEEAQESTVSFLDRFLSQKEEDTTPAETPDPVVEKAPVVESPVEVAEEKPALEEVVETAAETVSDVVEEAPEVETAPEEVEAPSVVSAAESASWEITEEEKPASILDKLQSSSQTIADKFAPAQSNGNVSTSVNGNRKIQLEEIPIHKQYQYVQKVFDGNNVRFRVIVEKVNNAQNKAEVESLVKKYILSNDSLNPDDLVVSEFITLLRNRF